MSSKVLMLRAAIALALLALLGPLAARCDDRDLLRSSIADPYLFIMLDTSGSMNWSPHSDACPTGDCFVPLQGDDENSKFYQAKQAMFQVLTDPTLPKVYFGFSTYNQDQLAIAQKHWLYKASGNGVQLSTSPSVFFPAAGAQEVFGTVGTTSPVAGWICDTGNNNNETGCYAASPAHLETPWEYNRILRLPKGGVNFATTIPAFFISSNGVSYKVTYQPSGGSYGSGITVKVTVLKCNNAGCTSTAPVAGSPATVNYTLVSDFISWDNGDSTTLKTTNPELAYFTGVAVDSLVNSPSTCNGWDPNTDTVTTSSVAGDQFTAGGYDLRFPTDSSDTRGGGGASGPFSIGDVIPLDWTTDHKTDILKRLAPNYVDSSTTPDFRIATYLKNSRSGSDAFLKLNDESKRPLIATGSTPLGASVKNFRTWYSGCSNDTCGSVGGWAAVAGAQDSSFQCRQKYLLILTDGDETCGGDPCKYTKLLKDQYNVTTFVVAFGVTATTGNTLSCMADASHTFYPQTQSDLVAALKTVFDNIKQQASTFASAAVPSVQAEIADRIYLSSFTPLGAASNPSVPGIWDGHLDGFLKPLPLDSDGKPDRDKVPHCDAPGGAVRSSCWLWDAGTSLVSQAPSASDLSGGLTTSSLRLGLGDTQRRVFYPRASTAGVVPSTLQLFSLPAGDPKTNPTPDWSDLLTGMGLSLPTTTGDASTAKTKVTEVIQRLLEVKTATLKTPGLPDQNLSFVLGDIFHADPVLVDRPNDFNFYAANLYAKAGTTDCTNNPGYQCFAQQQRFRRKMLLVGANDGQLHAFDGGYYDPSTKTFTDGTGKELFSYIPRLALPIVYQQMEGGQQIFGVDGTPRVEDVFIDPNHAAGSADATKREWRTVAIGGFREGGSVDRGGRLLNFTSGYYALDMTHPDKLDADNNPSQQTVPTCITTDNTATSGCGTLPFPAVLWEFTDSIGASQLDEDGDGQIDLGQTWSVPTVGRIKVIEDSKVVDKFVAIFGGGMDATEKPTPNSGRGTWLYMVDIETGQAIYKHRLTGAAPSDVAALDVNLDGYLDTIYIGTLSGFLYKVDISSPGTLQDVSLTVPQPSPASPITTTVKRITDASWEPFAIFDTGNRPIYFAPTLFYVSQLSRFALAFGTGDRENLWNLDGQTGRFYLIIDDGFKTGMMPKTESDYEQIDSASTDFTAAQDFILKPETGKSQGWVLQLPANERVITQSFGLSGIIIFSGFQPQEISTDPSAVCARGGSSHIYVVYSSNANSVMQIGTTPTRFRVVPEFVTSPYVEQGATKNTPPASGGGGSTTPNSEQLDATQQAILQQLKKFFPKGTKFANYWISVSGIRSDTGYERYATIPVGIIERNWKEF